MDARATLCAGIDEADGKIWLQAFARVFGYAFNPVSFWFCHDRDGRLRALLAEVRNTFGARHGYLLSAKDNASITADTRLICKKVLHVSPFCRVEGSYTFRVKENVGSILASVSIDYHDVAGLLIRTALAGRLTPLTRTSTVAALIRQPFLTVGVVARIHWQALRLALKQVPFYGKAPAPVRIADASPDIESDAAVAVVQPGAAGHAGAGNQLRMGRLCDARRTQGFDEIFVRTWRLYLAYCEAGFDEGRTDVMQFVLSRVE